MSAAPDIDELSRVAWPQHRCSRFVQAGGLRWHLQRQGSGPALLLVHGTGASTHSWRGVMPQLASGFSVLAVDLPGHGFSGSLPAGGMSIAGIGASLAELLRTIGFDPQFVVGHSAGAVVLCRMALDGHIHPRVVVSENGAFAPPAGAAGVLFAPIARLMAGVTLVPRLLAWSAGRTANVARLIESTGSRLDAEGIDLYARLVRDPRHVAGAIAMMANWDLHAFARELPRLRTPLALIVAGNDRAVPPQQADWVRQRVASATIHPVPGLGHLAHEEDPPRLARLIAAICRGQPG